MRLGCLGAALTIGLLWGGGQGVYQAVTNRAPTEVTCADLDLGLPKGAWLRVSGCTGSLLDASFKTRLGVVTEVYLPLHAKRDGETEPPAHLVLATRDREVVDLAKKMSKIDSKDIKAMLGFVAENAKRLRHEKEVEGMVRSGIDSDDKVLKHLREKKEGLAADFVVLDDGRKPGFLSALLLGAGVLLLLLLGAGAVLQAGSASS